MEEMAGSNAGSALTGYPTTATMVFGHEETLKKG